MMERRFWKWVLSNFKSFVIFGQRGGVLFICEWYRRTFVTQGSFFHLFFIYLMVCVNNPSKNMGRIMVVYGKSGKTCCYHSGAKFVRNGLLKKMDLNN